MPAITYSGVELFSRTLIVEAAVIVCMRKLFTEEQIAELRDEIWKETRVINHDGLKDDMPRALEEFMRLLTVPLPRPINERG